MTKQSKLTSIRFLWNLSKTDTAAVIILKFLTAAFFSVETIVVATLLDSIIDTLSDASKIEWKYFIYVLLIWVLKQTFSWLYDRCKVRIKNHANTEIPLMLLQKKRKLSCLSLENKENLELMRRIGSNPADRFVEYLDNTLSLLEILIKLLGLLLIIAAKSVWLAVIAALVILPYYRISLRNGKNDYEAYAESERHFRRADYYRKVLSDRKNVEERTLFGYGDYFNNLWSEEYRSAMKIECKANRKIFLRTGAVDVCATITVGIFAAFLLVPVWMQTMTAGLYMSLLKSMINYVETISTRFAQKMMGLEKGRLFWADYKNFMALEEAESTAGNAGSENAGKERVAGNTGSENAGRKRTGRECTEKENRVFTQIQSVEFRDVCFAYPNTDRYVLKHMSFYLEGNKKYAIVGANGAGKSTMTKLLLGFYPDYTGEILVNGINIKKLHEDCVRQCFSLVPQDITRYELRLDEYLKTADMEKVRTVFAQLEIDYFDLNEGAELYRNLGRLEKDAVDLSGGQWQLLSIARSILTEAPAHILDEPTAAIDPIREAELYALFQRVIADKFAILITHRLGAARMADEILVLEDGKVTEQGSHETLMKRKETYYHMFDTQRKWYDA